jgi:hypothetical protein
MKKIATISIKTLGPLSLSGGKYKLTKSDPITTTDQQMIAWAENEADLDVHVSFVEDKAPKEEVKEEAPKAVKKTIALARKKAARKKAPVRKKVAVKRTKG